ncbi:MAG TPA: sigma factor-like helix-turn-helix DNA-binding protein [Solirubrobacteraceae bacterium]
MPPREREVVLLKFNGQLSNSELARALGISESNAGTRLHRALTRLREGSLQAERQEEIA